MNRLLTLAVMLSLLVISSGCKDTHAKLADESMPIMRDMVATISTIKDAATAKSARPKLEAIAKRMKALEERRSKLPAPTEAEFKAMLEKHGKEMEELQMKMVQGMMALQFDPKIQAELSGIDLDMK
ncbi:MAG TPA: hypothetical protein PK402_03535 [Tepidisphaeraceae bacterium]|nr:hypothetical protein [Tepidisphaeraceae bacterium]